MKNALECSSNLQSCETRGERWQKIVDDGGDAREMKERREEREREKDSCVNFEQPLFERLSVFFYF